MGVTLQERIKPDIITALQEGPKTLSQLATSIGRNYYTTRGAVQQLIDAGEVSPVGYQQRNGLYKLGTSDVVRNSMTTVTTRGNKHKIIDLLNMRNPQPLAAIAVLNLPKHVVRILNLVKDLPQQEAESQILLNRIFDQVRSDRQALVNALEIYDDLLNNPRNWNVKSVERFKVDPDYDEDRIADGHKFFFPASALMEQTED